MVGSRRSAPIPEAPVLAKGRDETCLTSEKIETIGLTDQPSAITTGAGYVWVLSKRSGKVIRIDPKSKQVDKTLRLANPPLAAAVRNGRVSLAIGD